MNKVIEMKLCDIQELNSLFMMLDLLFHGAGIVAGMDAKHEHPDKTLVESRFIDIKFEVDEAIDDEWNVHVYYKIPLYKDWEYLDDITYPRLQALLMKGGDGLDEDN